MRVALTVWIVVERVSPAAEIFDGIRKLRILHAFEANKIGQPLVVQPGGGDGCGQIHLEFQNVQHDRQRGVDNRAASGAAGDEHDAAVSGDDRRAL